MICSKTRIGLFDCHHYREGMAIETYRKTHRKVCFGFMAKVDVPLLLRIIKEK